MAKVTIEGFDKEVKKILDSYGDKVSENLDAITQQVGKKGAELLKSESKASFNRTGRYAKGWTSKVERGRLYSTVIIYNRTPGLPHLLEHGHAIVGGGRSVGRFAGRVHIAPVENKLIKEYERKVTEQL